MTATDLPESTARRAASRALFARVASRGDRIVLPLNANAAAADQAGTPALYCIHSLSGAGGADFLPLAGRLGGAVRVYGVQAPPARMRDASFGASLASLAALYANAIAETEPSAGLVLAGWSAGAVIALEVAQQLRRRGREVSMLVAFDGAPVIPGAGLRRWDPRYALAVAARLPVWLRDMRAMEKRFRTSAMLRRLRSLLARLGRAALLREPEATVRLRGVIDLEHYPPAEQAFMARLHDAIHAYEPQPWPGPVVVYEAGITPALTLPQYLERWRRVAPQAELVRLDGNHITIMREPRVADLAGDLALRLTAPRAAGGPDRR